MKFSPNYNAMHHPQQICNQPTHQGSRVGFHPYPTNQVRTGLVDLSNTAHLYQYVRSNHRGAMQSPADCNAQQSDLSTSNEAGPNWQGVATLFPAISKPDNIIYSDRRDLANTPATKIIIPTPTVTQTQDVEQARYRVAGEHLATNPSYFAYFTSLHPHLVHSESTGLDQFVRINQEDADTNHSDGSSDRSSEQFSDLFSEQLSRLQSSSAYRQEMSQQSDLLSSCQDSSAEEWAAKQSSWRKS